MLVREDARHHDVVQHGLGVHSESLGDGDDAIGAERTLVHVCRDNQNQNEPSLRRQSDSIDPTRVRRCCRRAFNIIQQLKGQEREHDEELHATHVPKDRAPPSKAPFKAPMMWHQSKR